MTLYDNLMTLWKCHPKGHPKGHPVYIGIVQSVQSVRNVRMTKRKHMKTYFCVVCGEILPETHRSDQIYCNSRCKVRNHRLKKVKISRLKCV